MLTSSNILITGGAGFIGSNLVESFLQNDNRVVCLDDLSNGKFENISEYISDKNFTFIKGDIRNINDCRKACSGVEYIFHHAALGSVPRSIEDPMTTADVNVIGFINILSAAKDFKIKRLIYASSSSVYGDDDTLPKIETTLGKPLSPYAVTKRANEMYAENFSRLFGMEIIGLRYFNVFGKKQDLNGAYAAVIPKFISSMIKGESPVIYGDGKISRDFTHVDNVVLANHLAVTAALFQIPYSVSPVFNIACGSATSINDLFGLIKKEIVKFNPDIFDLKPVYEAPRKGEILHSNANIVSANKHLGYIPKINLAEGLAKTVEWYLRQL